ncbi:hypothetical protein HELRODRAFT_183250 [Helobdella robusta]|uniref:Uncharacterized protein n=1 Tax=Helobdella robusta TaxID=6412 RepID=T1FJD4_HELRO|nr:hypothetical protein HELRODRAFT_183250 [Helobdella robusta]ESO11370.1 hypothetical protein HELRODRAFT_183250 [Helobdella robusta]
MLKFSERHQQRLVQVTESNITELMASVDFILMGLGGVYWLGKDVFPGSGNVAEGLKKIGQHIVYFTNNDMHTREFIQNQLTNLGIKDVKPNEICSLSHATAVYLRDHLKISDGVFCLGPSALLSELKNNNVKDCRDGKPFEDFLFGNEVQYLIFCSAFSFPHFI